MVQSATLVAPDVKVIESLCFLVKITRFFDLVVMIMRSLRCPVRIMSQSVMFKGCLVEAVVMI